MAGLEASGSNPDVSLLYEINGVAADAPHWFDRTMEFVGEYGTIFALVLLGLWAWWSVRKRPSGEAAVSGVAGLIWAPLAAAVALVVNIPIRGFVGRPRPFVDHQGLEVLVKGKTDFSFVSDHATLAMALAVGIFVAHRRLGLAAIGVAFFAGISRVYMGVHYPTDVIGGFALGTAVALLLAPPAMLLLTPVVSLVSRSARGAWLVRSPAVAAETAAPSALPGQDRRAETADGERDLAA